MSATDILPVRLLQGNEACVEAALAAGLRFYAGYPITPSTEIAEQLSLRLPLVGGIFIQMEDEIASLAAVIGASLGGLKAMTATSGPGFSLMQENLGYACAAEVPCVIVDVQRAGPSTGQPTSPSQGDVMQSRWGTHGDHPIIVLCPSSVEEVYYLTIRAFNLSERFRSPVVLLMDEVVGHLREKVLLSTEAEVLERPRPVVPPEWYFPFEDPDTDVPPLVSFGSGYRYHVTGLFHDRAGFPTLRPDEINPWFERVFRKIDESVDEIVETREEWMDDAEIAVIAYGISARSARAAVQRARAAGRRAGFVKLNTIWPFDARTIDRVSEQVKLLVVPEMNRGQLILEVERVARGRASVRAVNRVDGELISPDQVLAALET